ncbi:MAG: hypothetical protein IIY88_06175 [Eubacterium sp.]|nr:hypothetical protein [Eubacterium sp.]
MIYIGCILTCIIELIVFAAAGYGKEKYFLLLTIAVNTATNLTINLILAGYRSPVLIALLEAAVVLTEYAVYAAVAGRSRRLFALTFAANAASFLFGGLVFGI